RPAVHTGDRIVRTRLRGGSPESGAAALRAFQRVFDLRHRGWTVDYRLFNLRHLCLEHHAVAVELLDDRKKAGVEEAHLEQDEEWERAVNAVDQRIVYGGREIEAETQFDER